MDINILKRKNLVAIYLVYRDRIKKMVKVDVHFIDKDVCYLETDLWDNNLRKPRNNQKAEILAYTMNGLYIGNTKIVDTTVTLPKVMFTVENPKKWNYTKTRSSVRKIISLPFTIKYNDGYEIKANTIDISLGGITFALTDEPILPMYYNFNGEIEIDLSNSEISAEVGTVLKSEVKYLREMSTKKASTYVYRFISMDSHYINILKLLLKNNDEVIV